LLVTCWIPWTRLVAGSMACKDEVSANRLKFGPPFQEQRQMSRRNVKDSESFGGDTSTLKAAEEKRAFSNQLLLAMLSFRSGDFSARLPSDLMGLDGKIADAFNDVISVCERRAQETARVSRAVGKEGKLKQRMVVPDVRGSWAEEV